MRIFLLTHERELRRATNTGSIAIENAQNIVERILWERTFPNDTLTQLIKNNEAVLLYSAQTKSPSEYPSTACLPTTPITIEDYENIIIIDATWQESKKIFNQSPYLKNTPQFTLKTTHDSLYTLRANQPKGGLCTIECIIEVLKLKAQHKMAAELSLKFDLFNC